ncbi:hypothetical protein Nmel_000723 [Mimus melanotis]
MTMSPSPLTEKDWQQAVSFVQHLPREVNCGHCPRARANQRDRKDGGFGSTGPLQVFWTMNISSQRPQMVCTLSVPTANPPQIQLRDITQSLDCSLLKEVDNAVLIRHLKTLWCSIQARAHPYYVLHIRSHMDLPGFLTEGLRRDMDASSKGLYTGLSHE